MIIIFFQTGFYYCHTFLEDTAHSIISSLEPLKAWPLLISSNLISNSGIEFRIAFFFISFRYNYYIDNYCYDYDDYYYYYNDNYNDNNNDNNNNNNDNNNNNNNNNNDIILLLLLLSSSLSSSL